jgi:hypothetical protein
MQKRRLLMAAVAFGVFLSVAGAQEQSSNKDQLQDSLLFQCSIVEDLDARIQARFVGGKMVFGGRRVGPIYEHLPRFKPDNNDEQAVVADLEDAGWGVGFYLAGRGVLQDRPPQPKPQYPGYVNPLISRPVMITKNLRYDSLPQSDQLLAEARNAMNALSKSSQYDFSFSDWKFSVRPLRAREECLKCHLSERLPPSENFTPTNSTSQFKSGDLLGAAMYAYRQVKPQR